MSVTTRQSHFRRDPRTGAMTRVRAHDVEVHAATAAPLASGAVARLRAQADTAAEDGGDEAMSLAAMTPKEVDEALANEMGTLGNALSRLERIDTRRRHRTADPAALDAEERELQAEVAERRGAINEMNAEFERRGRWRRWFLVTNGDGHVHSSTGCSSCFSTTQFAFLAANSDDDEAFMVQAYGEQMCTLCVPSAPTLPGWGTSPLMREREHREGERLRRREAAATKKAANAVTSADGTPLYDAYRSRIDTVTAARSALKDTTANLLTEAEDHHMAADWRAAEERLAEALAAKTGEDVAAIRDDARRRATLAVRKGFGEGIAWLHSQPALQPELPALLAHQEATMRIFAERTGQDPEAVVDAAWKRSGVPRPAP